MPVTHRLQRGGEVFEDDDGLGAGVLQLVFQFARRVERVDVDHHVAGAQHAASIATGYCSTLGIMMATRAPLAPAPATAARRREVLAD